jgi:hypothetical protein
MAMNKMNPDLTIAIVSFGILAAAAVSKASNTVIKLAGIQLPTVCGFKLLTSLDCPGCGLTRSLVFAIHGHFRESYFMHIWGIPLLIILILQVPYRLFRAVKPDWIPFQLPEKIKKWISPAVFLSFLVPWGIKTLAYVVIRYL